MIATNPIKTRKTKITKSKEFQNKTKQKKNGYSNTWFALASHLSLLLSEKINLECDPPPHILANSSHIF
jgi:hypothetical protein